MYILCLINLSPFIYFLLDICQLIAKCAFLYASGTRGGAVLMLAGAGFWRTGISRSSVRILSTASFF